MTVQELINHLQTLSPETKVVIRGYEDGYNDILKGKVRFVGKPAQRIAEDYLRILRFFRFFARFGRAPADPAALSAIAAGMGGLAQLSAERVWSEMKRILAAPRPDAALALMRETRVMQAVLPGAAPALASRWRPPGRRGAGS